MTGSLTLVQQIEALGERWHEWRRSEWCRSRAAERLCGGDAPPRAPEIVVGSEEFNIAGEIMLCLRPECGGFVRGLVQRESHVYWAPRCRCPACGQRYRVRSS